MGKIVVTEFVSVDGVMEAPGGEPNYKHTGWVTWTPDSGQFAYKLDELREHDALLIGRVTYESFAGAWPSREGEMAEKINAMPKFVVSTTMETADWHNSSVVNGDVDRELTKLKAEYDGNILVYGSHKLVQTLKRLDLVDEYRLMIFPVVLGSGFRMFDAAEDATRLKLVDSRSFDSGVALLVYEVERAAS